MKLLRKPLAGILLTAIGKTIIRENSNRGTNVPYHVIGVVKDFNFKSLHEPITPLLMTLEPDNGLIFKVKTADIQNLLATMKKKWMQFNTGESFTYNFMDDLYNKTYSAEQKTGTILNIFAFLPSSLPVWVYLGWPLIQQNSVPKKSAFAKCWAQVWLQVTKMLSTDFIKLVFIACLIAFPLSWWAMNKWLQSFAYLIVMMKQLLIFQNLSDAHILELFAYCNFRNLLSGDETIVTQDTLSPYLYGILRRKSQHLYEEPGKQGCAYQCSQLRRRVRGSRHIHRHETNRQGERGWPCKTPQHIEGKAHSVSLQVPGCG